jgi:transposase
MDAVEQLKQELMNGHIDVQSVLQFILHIQQKLQATEQKLQATEQKLQATEQKLQATEQKLHCAQQRIAELEQKQNPPAGSPTARVDTPYSMRAEEKRQQKGKKGKKLKLSRKGRRGRLTTADKIKLAEGTEPCYPEGVRREDCWLSHTRVVWRLKDGRAVLVAYQVFRGPKDAYGKVPGVLGRSEFGLEIVLEIAALVYEIGLSFDKACATLGFLQQIKLGKTQADRLLHQLARHWEEEFEVLCTLLANALVVYADETSWSINSVWAFLSEKARVLLFGVHRDGATLKTILDAATFGGLVISDDAAVYGSFTHRQKCWAHLLRKAIKLSLQEPDNPAYRALTDELLDIYQQACRVRRDGRLGAVGRQKKVAELTARVRELCGDEPQSAPATPEPEGPAKDFRLLVNEVLRVSLEGKLFTFVTTEPVTQPNGQSAAVSGTNNEAERTLRDPAAARDTRRANKTLIGARRQSIIVTVLESLTVYLPKFTLSAVVTEIMSWWRTGESCFKRLLRKLNLKPPDQSILDEVLPIPNTT